MMKMKNQTYIKPTLELKALILEGMIATTPNTEVPDVTPGEGENPDLNNRSAKGGFNFDWSEL